MHKQNILFQRRFLLLHISRSARQTWLENNVPGQSSSSSLPTQHPQQHQQQHQHQQQFEDHQQQARILQSCWGGLRGREMLDCEHGKNHLRYQILNLFKIWKFSCVFPFCSPFGWVGG